MKISKIQIVLLVLMVVVFFVTVLYSNKKDIKLSLNSFKKPASQKIIKKGEVLFAQNCTVCHGQQAIGENPRQPKGGIKENGVYLAPALNGSGHAWHHTNEVLFSTIKNGSVDKTSPMQGFNGRLTDAEIISIMHYFQSFWPKEVVERRGSMQ